MSHSITVDMRKCADGTDSRVGNSSTATVEDQEMNEDEVIASSPLYLDIDEMLHMVGDYHLFQKIIVAIFYFSNIPPFFQLMLTLFATISPEWRCSSNSTVCTSPGTETYSPKNVSRCNMNRSDWQYTEPTDFSIVTEFDLVCKRKYIVELVNSVVFFGFMFGALVLGPCADKFGRKRVLYSSLAVVLLLSSVGVFTGNIYAFITTRFVVGFFLHGTFPQAVVMISELVGDAHRAFCLSIVTTIVAGLSMPFLALQASFISKWKVLFLVCTVPYSCLLLCARFVPESVRYLRVHGDMLEVMQVFRRIAYWNKTHIPCNVRIAPVVTHATNNNNKNDRYTSKNCESPDRKKTAGPLDLFRTVRLATITLVIGFSSLTISMTNYALGFEAGNLTGHMYRDFAIINLSRVPAGILVPLILNCLGRKKAMMMFGLIGGVSCLILGFTPADEMYKVLRLVCGICGIMSMEGGGISYRTWALELFPTDLRGAGMGFSQFTNKVGATSSAWIVTDLSKVYSGAGNFLIGCMGLAAFILQGVLRETKGVKTADTRGELDEICKKRETEEVVGYVNTLAEDGKEDKKVTTRNPYEE